MVGRIVVFRKDSGAIFGAEDYDCIDGEKGHIGRHDCGVEAGARLSITWEFWLDIAIEIANVVNRGWCLGCEVSQVKLND